MTGRCNESTEQLAREVLAFRQQIQSLGESIGALQSLGIGLRKARRRTLRTVRDLSTASARIVHAVEGDFAQAAEKHREAVQAEARAAEFFHSLAKMLVAAGEAVKAGSSTLRESAQTHRAASTELDRCFKEDLGPAVRTFQKSVNQVGSTAETLGRISRDGLGATAQRLAELPAVVDRIKASAETFRVLADLGGEIKALKNMLAEMRAGVAAFHELAGLKGDVLALIDSLREARGVSDAVAGLPALFRESLMELTREALRRQSDELQEVLGHILKQHAYLLSTNGRSS
jgi:hypothetical protein